MNALFHPHFADLSLAYAVALLMLGAVLAVSPRREATLPCAPHLWLVAVFALVRGTYELAVLRALLGASGGFLPVWASALWLLAAFLPLFEFGRRVLGTSLGTPFAPRWMTLLRPAPLYAAVAIGIAGMSLLSAAPATGTIAGVRIFLGLPGALMTGIGLLRCWRTEALRSAPALLSGHVALAGAAAIAYGLLSPVLRGFDAPLPLWIPTADGFSAIFGVPLQLPRALAAVVLTYALIQAVYRANVRAERLEAELAQSQARILEAEAIGHLGSWDYDPVSGLRKWSPEMYRIFGFDPAQAPPVSNDAIMERVHPEDRAAWAAELQRSLEGKDGAGAVRFRLRMPDGTEKVVDIWRQLEPGSGGGKPRLFGVVQDVTGQIRASEAARRSEARLKAAQRIARLGAWEWDIATGALSWSDEVYPIFGLERSGAALTYDGFLALVHPEDRPELEAAVGQILAAGQYIEREYRICRPDGAVRRVRIWAEMERGADGKALRMMGGIQDVTEAKTAEDELFKQRDLLRAVFDALPVMVTVKGRDSRLIMVNQQAVIATGMRPDAFLGNRAEDLRFGPRPVSPRHAALDRDILQGTIERVDYEAEEEFVAGRVVAMQISKVPFRDAQGAVAGVVSISTDVTERKRAEEERRLNTARLNEAQRMAQVGNWELDLVSGALTWSDEIFRIFEIDKARFAATYAAFLNAIHPDDRDAVNAAYTRSLETREPYEITHRLRMADGRIKHVQERCESFWDAHGKPIRSVGTVQDISDRVRAEEALRETQRRQQSILDSMYAFVGLFGLDGTLLDLNRAPLEAGGVRREDVVGKPFWESVWFAGNPRTQEQLRSILGRVARGEPVREELTVQVARSGPITMDATFSPIRDAAGRVIQIVGSGVDVTDRVRARQALRETETRLQQTIEALPAGFLLYDPNERLVQWNRYMGELFPDLLPRLREGMTYEEATRIAMDSFSGTPEERQLVYEQRIRNFRSGTNSALVELANGRTVQFANLRAPDGSTICLRFDVTEERRKDIEIDRQRRFLENLIAIAPVIVLLLDRDGRIDHFNPYLEKLSGYRLDEVRGEDWIDTFLPERERARIRSLLDTSIQGIPTRGNINPIVSRNGIERQIEWNDSAIRGNDGEIVGVLAIGHDVTEQLRAEEEIQANRRRMAAVLGSISDGFFSLNTRWIYTYVNENAARFVGKTPEELLGRRIWDVFPEAEGSSWHKRYQQVMESGEPVQFEDYYEQLDAWYAGAVYPFEDGISIYFHNATEQRRATDRIAAQLREKEVLLREIHHRVKNNLQVVSSLLYLQQQQTQRPEDAAVLRESRNRVAAMSLVHEKLYSSTNLAEVDLVEYARDLTMSLLATFGADPRRVALRVEGKRFPLPLDRAITWGLLVNEIVSNSLKHAFPGETSGEIVLALEERDGVCELTIRDNGVGHHYSETNQPKGSLGMRLIPRLAEQLGAAIERTDGPGTGYRLLLPKEKTA